LLKWQARHQPPMSGFCLDGAEASAKDVSAAL
jgi:hypothetical protein